MIPILYEETEIEFKTNGIGRLADAISCTVTEERNGVYELEMEYPETGKLFKELKHSRIIGAVPSEDASIQGFRIYKISKPISGTVTVSAEHISYQLSHIPTLLPGTVVTSAQSALQLLSDNAMVSNPFSFTTDVTAAGSFSADGLYSIRGILAGTAGSVLQAFGGEYEFDNWHVILHSARGTKTDVFLDYGKNITDFKQEENIENTSTSVVAYWENRSSDSGVTRVVGDIQNSDNVNRFPYNRPLLLDCSQDYKDAPTKDQLNAKAQSYIKANNIGVPSVSIDVSFVALWQTEEYKGIAPLEKVHLCDTLTVRFSKLGVETTAKVIKTEYNVLMDRYNKISIGDTKYTLTDTILNINDEIKQTSDKIATDMQNAIDHATRLINGGLGGYVVITPNETTGYPEEILIMDTPSKQTAKNVIRLNKNGIGFSLGNGYDGPFQSAWTIDGAFNANWITTGTIKSKNGLSYWDLDNAIFADKSDNGAEVLLTNGGVNLTVGSTTNSSTFVGSIRGQVGTSDESKMSVGINAIPGSEGVQLGVYQSDESRASNYALRVRKNETSSYARRVDIDNNSVLRPFDVRTEGSFYIVDVDSSDNESVYGVLWNATNGDKLFIIEAERASGGWVLAHSNAGDKSTYHDIKYLKSDDKIHFYRECVFKNGYDVDIPFMTAAGREAKIHVSHGIITGWDYTS